MDKTENFSDILDFSKEKLSEGDYIKLADFLKNIHTFSEKIVRHKSSKDINAVLEFDTYKGKHYVIKVDTFETLYFTGDTENETAFIGSINDVPFRYGMWELRRIWSARINFHGAKNIKRTLMGSDIETFRNMKDFRTYLQERNDDEKDEDDEEEDVNEWGNEYVTGLLFGFYDYVIQ